MRKIKAVTVKIKTVTGVDKGGKNLIYVVYSVYEINSKIYFPSRHIIFGGGSSYICIKTFCLGRHVSFGLSS